MRRAGCRARGALGEQACGPLGRGVVVEHGRILMDKGDAGGDPPGAGEREDDE